MKVTFLGTSHGAPSPTRYCTATLLEVAGRAYLIDAGAPLADLLVRAGVPYESLRAIFTTHLHADHTFGMLSLCSLSCWWCKKAAFDVYFTEEALRDAVRGLLRAARDELDETRVHFCMTAPGRFYDDGVLRVTACPTRHTESIHSPSYAYLVEAEGKRLLFCGDLHQRDAADFPAEAAAVPSELIVCELSHFAPEVIFEKLAGCPTKQVLFHHVGHGYEASMAAIRAADGKYPFAVRAVEDGDSFTL